MDATSPLASGQLTSRMAEFFMVASPAVHFAGQRPALLFQFFEDLSRGVCSRASGQACAGMGSAAAQVEILDGRAIAHRIQQVAHGEELIKSKIAVKNLAAGYSVDVFEILRRDDLVRENH